MPSTAQFLGHGARGQSTVDSRGCPCLCFIVLFDCHFIAVSTLSLFPQIARLDVLCRRRHAAVLDPPSKTTHASTSSIVRCGRLRHLSSLRFASGTCLSRCQLPGLPWPDAAAASQSVVPSDLTAAPDLVFFVSPYCMAVVVHRSSQSACAVAAKTSEADRALRALRALQPCRLAWCHLGWVNRDGETKGMAIECWVGRSCVRLRSGRFVGVLLSVCFIVFLSLFWVFISFSIELPISSRSCPSEVRITLHRRHVPSHRTRPSQRLRFLQGLTPAATAVATLAPFPTQKWSA